MSDELSGEDQLRLNVLLSQNLRAIRIDESRMELRALTDKGEAVMPLNPNCRSDKYLRLVREVLSGHALGSPGGFPVYLSRWTRHGQMASDSLARLLLTGEPEAVVAVVYSPALDDDLAEAAWWTMPTIENARLMLRREAVAQGRMGPILADFLVEHLPFLQDDHLAIMDTITVLLHSGCLTQEGLVSIWNRGKHCNTYYVAFLEWQRLPVTEQADDTLGLSVFCRFDNALAEKLNLAYSAPGQAFIEAALEILARPETQEVVSRTLNAIGAFFRVSGAEDAAQVLVERPDLAPAIEAVHALALVDESMILSEFARSTAIGSLMRRKIGPIVAPVQTHLRGLLATQAP